MAARAQQHGGVRFCRAPRQPEQQHGGVRFHRAYAFSAQGHNSTAACASTWRHFSSQSTAAQARALLQSATTARAQQHGGACASTERRSNQGTTGAPCLPLHFFSLNLP
jgi:hypothetical protein